MNGNIAKEKQRIADLLESLDLYLEWLYIFDRLCLKLKDKNGKEVWSLRAIDIDYLRTELSHFLKMNKEKKIHLRPILDVCAKFNIDDFSNIDKLNAASEKVFAVYHKQLEDFKMLPFSEAERDLMKKAFRIGFIGGVTAGTLSLTAEVNQHEQQMRMLSKPTKGGC